MVAQRSAHDARGGAERRQRAQEVAARRALLGELGALGGLEVCEREERMLGLVDLRLCCAQQRTPLLSEAAQRQRGERAEERAGRVRLALQRASGRERARIVRLQLRAGRRSLERLAVGGHKRARTRQADRALRGGAQRGGGRHARRRAPRVLLGLRGECGLERQEPPLFNRERLLEVVVGLGSRVRSLTRARTRAGEGG
jgi:hypothetical protein